MVVSGFCRFRWNIVVVRDYGKNSDAKARLIRWSKQPRPPMIYTVLCREMFNGGSTWAAAQIKLERALKTLEKSR